MDADSSPQMLDAHDHSQCIEDALMRAERVCADHGARLTTNRRRVLELVWRNHEVVSAYQLLELLQAEDPSTKPPTVYRALAFLLQQGLVHRIESANGFTRCESPHVHDSCQFLICDACGTVNEIHASDVIERLEGISRGAGFRPRYQTVELHGFCADCAPES